MSNSDACMLNLDRLVVCLNICRRCCFWLHASLGEVCGRRKLGVQVQDFRRNVRAAKLHKCCTCWALECGSIGLPTAPLMDSIATSGTQTKVVGTSRRQCEHGSGTTYRTRAVGNLGRHHFRPMKLKDVEFQLQLNIIIALLMD